MGWPKNVNREIRSTKLSDNLFLHEGASQEDDKRVLISPSGCVSAYSFLSQYSRASFEQESSAFGFWQGHAVLFVASHENSRLGIMIWAYVGQTPHILFVRYPR